MTWRQFKTHSMEKKVGKVEKPPPLYTLNTFYSAEGDLKNSPKVTGQELFNLISDNQRTIVRQGGDWTGWYESLADNSRQEIKRIQDRIDLTYGELDYIGLNAALEEYRAICLKTNALRYQKLH